MIWPAMYSPESIVLVRVQSCHQGECGIIGLASMTMSTPALSEYYAWLASVCVSSVHHFIISFRRCAFDVRMIVRNVFTFANVSDGVIITHQNDIQRSGFLKYIVRLYFPSGIIWPQRSSPIDNLIVLCATTWEASLLFPVNYNTRTRSSPRPSVSII